MGKHHTEEAVIPILLRKGLTVKEYDYDEQGVKSLVKQIGIPTGMQLGIRILGKLDFMRIKGWKVINKDDMKNPNVEYRLIPGNIIWGCLLVETIIAPIYFFGFSIYEPIGSKTTVEKGVINNTQS